MVVGSGDRTTFDHHLQLRSQFLVHTPDQLEQNFRHCELVTTLQRIAPVLTSGSGYLSLGGKPEVHPEREINEDYRVCRCQPALKAGPGAPAVHDPAPRCYDLIKRLGNDTFICLHPAGKPLDLINREEREVVPLGQLPSQRGLSASCISNDCHPLHGSQIRAPSSDLEGPLPVKIVDKMQKAGRTKPDSRRFADPTSTSPQPPSSMLRSLKHLALSAYYAVA